MLIYIVDVNIGVFFLSIYLIYNNDSYKPQYYRYNLNFVGKNRKALINFLHSIKIMVPICIILEFNQ